MDIGQLAASILTSLIVGTVIAYLTVRLSIRQFYSQRWWDRKAEAYTDILEAIYNMNYSTRALINFYEDDSSVLDVPTTNELVEKFIENYNEVRRHSLIGAFAISSEAADAISLLLSDIATDEADRSDLESMMAVLNVRAEIISGRIADIRDLAKKDLKGD